MPEGELSSIETVHGLLQRGRGHGYTRALTQDAAAPVLECIHHDPRWDDQVEDRGWYFASLIVALGIDVTAILPPLDTPVDPTGDSRCWLPTDVLSLCARRGVGGAVTELRRYLRSGRDPGLAVERLLPFAADAEADGFIEDLLGASDADSIEAALVFAPTAFEDPPWPRLRRANRAFDEIVRSVIARRVDPPPAAIRAHVQRIANVWNVVGAPRREPRIGERGETTQELLEEADRQPRYAVGFARALRTRTSSADRALLVAAATSGGEGARAAALLALGAQHDDVLLDVGLPILTRHDEPDRIQGAVLRGLRRLSSERAIEWARSSALDSTCGYPARTVLTTNARETDLPQLRSLLDWARDQDAVYDQCNIVEAIDRLRDATAASAIGVIYDDTAYSYLRKRCAFALARLDPRFGEGRAVECLWDCEAATRAHGVANAAPSRAGVGRRLAAMLRDPIEDDTVKEAVGQRSS